MNIIFKDGDDGIETTVNVDINIGKANVKEEQAEAGKKRILVGAGVEKTKELFRQNIMSHIPQEEQEDFKVQLENYVKFHIYDILGLSQVPLEIQEDEDDEIEILKGIQEDIEYNIVDKRGLEYNIIDERRNKDG